MQQTLEGFHLSPQQARLWRHQQRGGVYLAHCSVLIEGEVQVSRLPRALEMVISRHEIYRTDFHRLPGVAVPIQIVREHPDYAWYHLDLSGCACEEEQQKLAEVNAGVVDRLDRGQGPALSCLLITLGPRRYLLHISLPALSADTQTLQLFVRELAQWYERPDLEEESAGEIIQYVQFSEWQNSLLEEEEGSAGLAYWRERRTTRPGSFSLPFELKKMSEEAAFQPALLSVP